MCKEMVNSLAAGAKTCYNTPKRCPAGGQDLTARRFLHRGRFFAIKRENHTFP